MNFISAGIQKTRPGFEIVFVNRHLRQGIILPDAVAALWVWGRNLNAFDEVAGHCATPPSMQILVSDILGIFSGDTGLYVRIKRPDGSFREGDVLEDDAVTFSARLKEARASDDSAEFDCSVVKNWKLAD